MALIYNEKNLTYRKKQTQSKPNPNPIQTQSKPNPIPIWIYPLHWLAFLGLDGYTVGRWSVIPARGHDG
jgi:hypothetical protein